MGKIVDSAILPLALGYWPMMIASLLGHEKINVEKGMVGSWGFRNKKIARTALFQEQF